MTLKDLLKKKDKVQAQAEAQGEASSQAVRAEDGGQQQHEVPEFTFMRTTTTTQEIISPPSFPGDRTSLHPSQPPPKRHSRFRRHSNASSPGTSAERDSLDTLGRPKNERRLSERLHLGSRSRSASTSSINIPSDLPEIEGAAARGVEEEAEWEKRATILAKSNPNQDVGGEGHGVSVSDAKGDENIQEAIRLHEEGDLANSTAMFGRLADPNGANNALSQVLYGLALRHGWGIAKDETRAVIYLSHAASNSADIESLALEAGMKKGGAAKGELTLAIFELANCFRNGWGVKKDPLAAKQYYETAANMGDTDAMNEVAWCYLEGFGCKKDKFRAAQYLRLAEEKGSKTLGNSWIWKDKYGGPRKT